MFRTPIEILRAEAGELLTNKESLVERIVKERKIIDDKRKYLETVKHATQLAELSCMESITKAEAKIIGIDAAIKRCEEAISKLENK